MYDEEVLSLEDDRLIDMAVRSLYIDLKEASSLVRESRSRMMAAGKLFLAQENSHGRLEPAAASLVTRWSLAYSRLFSGGDLRGKAAVDAKQEWGRADTALGLHVMSFVHVVFATCNSLATNPWLILGGNQPCSSSTSAVKLRNQMSSSPWQATLLLFAPSSWAEMANSSLRSSQAKV